MSPATRQIVSTLVLLRGEGPWSGNSEPSPLDWCISRQLPDISNAVLFLASDEAQYVTGLEFTVDAGNTIR